MTPKSTSPSHQLADPATLGRSVEVARNCVPLQEVSELYQAMTVAEIEAEQGLARWERAQRRRQRKRSVRGELAEQARQQRSARRLRQQDARQLRWLANARADRARATNPDALVGALHHRARRSSLLLRCVMGVGLLWSAVNVGRNLTPADVTPGPTWWLLWALSFGIEAMISVPILEIMAQAATAARLGQRVDRAKIVFFEAALLTGTVGLNCGPHLIQGSFGRAAEYAVAPVMVVVLMWLHAWLTTRYAELIEAVATTDSTTHDAATNDPSPAYTQHRSAGRLMQHVGGGSEDVVAYLPSDRAETDDPGHDPGAAGLGEDLARIAGKLVATGRSEKSVTEIVEILEFAATGMNANAVATAMSTRTGATWRRSTVDRIIARAVEFGFPVVGPRLEVVADQKPA
ncbi:hypothetical protein OHB12_11575 [Nocardia sp. NBC_01730]|uniref:hypothetical protein n=1 Tax=Nocardia sp. NBC_01730 TaxID=2975998 RepID=UPI002E118B49|nr:hypothetical protein OHB12_11575 [Nocardia sp. NBC_01730]